MKTKTCTRQKRPRKKPTWLAGEVKGRVIPQAGRHTPDVWPPRSLSPSLYYSLLPLPLPQPSLPTFISYLNHLNTCLITPVTHYNSSGVFPM